VGTKLTMTRRIGTFFQGALIRVILLVAVFVLAGNGIAGADENDQDPLVATVNGQEIRYKELYAYMMTGGLSREETLENIIDLYLIRAAAATFSIEAPTGTWSKEMRDNIEYSLATVMALDIPSTRVTLIVDHAWLKDAEVETEIMEGRAQITKMREMVANGSTIPQAFVKMKLDGAMWHIGDHEEYPYEVVPEEARDLKPGNLSPLIPGDGGTHLFLMYQRKEEKPPAETVHASLMAKLRDGASIEYAAQPQQ